MALGINGLSQERSVCVCAVDSSVWEAVTLPQTDEVRLELEVAVSHLTLLAAPPADPRWFPVSTTITRGYNQTHNETRRRAPRFPQRRQDTDSTSGGRHPRAPRGRHGWADRYNCNHLEHVEESSKLPCYHRRPLQCYDDNEIVTNSNGKLEYKRGPIRCSN